METQLLHIQPLHIRCHFWVCTCFHALYRWFLPEWCISTISCLRYTILVRNPRYVNTCTHKCKYSFEHTCAHSHLYYKMFINLYFDFREWYSYHFPELVKIVPDNYMFARAVQLIQDRRQMPEDIKDRLEEIVMDSAKAQAVIDASKSSMGGYCSASFTKGGISHVNVCACAYICVLYYFPSGWRLDICG